jgi:hypothetical protein
MRSIRFPPGGPLTVAQAPDPAPGPGQRLVHTEAVGAGIGLVRMPADAREPVSPVPRWSARWSTWAMA